MAESERERRKQAEDERLKASAKVKAVPASCFRLPTYSCVCDLLTNQVAELEAQMEVQRQAAERGTQEMKKLAEDLQRKLAEQIKQTNDAAAQKQREMRQRR